MKIGKIISIQQPQIHMQLNSRNNQNKKKNKKKKKDKDLSFREVQELMGHSSYKRGKGGAIHQVKYK